ncbi:MAG: class I SAM-dependent methyltransferase [Pseudomonadota bacterium]|nr:class I SAM-dependent methyltransferase [Pseudomonadota bacterium]MEE3282642.1 class I SAM-dependent methyltransferase [Pseudomonadota bacterium]
MESLAKVRDGYDRWAMVYDDDQNPLQALEGPLVQQACGNVQGLRVLDMGCGTGRHTLWLAQAGAEVTGIDFSEAMLAKAHEKAKGYSIDLIVHDLHQRLPFEAGQFDMIVSGLVLEHIADLAHYFSEIARVLGNPGRAVVSAMHPAMFLRDSQAQFTDPNSGDKVRPGSLSHQLSDVVMGAVSASLELVHFAEHSADAQLAEDFPRSEKYVGWPMLVLFEFRAVTAVQTQE